MNEENLMKKLMLLAAFVTVTAAHAGPNVSTGPEGTENLVSKRRIQAVMNAITDVNDVVEGVQLDSGRILYIAKVRNGEACSESYYKVEPVTGGLPATFVARFVGLISAGPCK